MGQAHQPGINRLPFISGEHPTGAGGNRGRQSGRPGRKQFWTRRDIHVPGHPAKSITWGVGTVHPSDDAADKRPAVSRVGRVAELFNEDGTVVEGIVNIGFPARRCIGALVVIDMSRVNNAVAGRSAGQAWVGDRCETRIVVGILLTPRDTDIVGVGAAGQGAGTAGRCAPDGVHNFLQAWRGKTGRVRGCASIEPDRPGVRIGLVKGVEEHRGIISVTGSHAGPEHQTVFVRHGVLLYRRPRGPVAGPLQIKITINVVGIAVGDDGVHEALIGRLAGGTP